MSLRRALGGFYKHYKGNRYYVCCLSTHTETQEKMVHYIGLYVVPGEREPCRSWCRPLEMWEENVEVDGSLVPRFSPAQPTDDDVQMVREYFTKQHTNLF